MCDTLFSSWLAIKGDVPQSSTLGHDHLLLMTYAYCRSLFQFADDSYLFVQLETETENGLSNTNPTDHLCATIAISFQGSCYKNS